MSPWVVCVTGSVELQVFMHIPLLCEAFPPSVALAPHEIKLLDGLDGLAGRQGEKRQSAMSTYLEHIAHLGDYLVRALDPSVGKTVELRGWVTVKGIGLGASLAATYYR